MRYLKFLVLLAAIAFVFPVTANSAPSGGSCLFSYETTGDLYKDTLYIYNVNQKAVRIDIVDTDTGTVVQEIFAYGSYVSLDIAYIDATTEFQVYANNNKPSVGGSGKLLAECYA